LIFFMADASIDDPDPVQGPGRLRFDVVTIATRHRLVQPPPDDAGVNCGTRAGGVVRRA
jgi:hypothetical protein